MLEEKWRFMELEEIRKQHEEEIEAEIACKKLDDQARKATQEWEFLTKQISRARGLRRAVREFEEAKLVSSLLQTKNTDTPTPP